MAVSSSASSIYRRRTLFVSLPLAHSLSRWARDLQGATSSDGPWATLRRHDNDTALEAHKERAVAAWVVEGSDVGYRFVRIRQHGANSSGSFYLCCAGIELYGTLTEASS